MSVNEAIKSAIDDSGRTQVWVAAKINAINPSLNMDKSKLSAALNGKRKISGDEFIALCKALEISLDTIAEKVMEGTNERRN